jgi:hypothetical protein
MKIPYLFPYLFALISLLFTSCKKEDPGQMQPGEATFSYSGFDKVEMGSAFDIRIRQANDFSILARGDQRNLNDLNVRVINGTLVVDYRHSRSRQYATSFEITMPALRLADFSGASQSNITGFDGDNDFEIRLSGASKSEVALQSPRQRVKLDLSGASRLQLSGQTELVRAELSGASVWRGYDLVSTKAEVEASGASEVQVNAVEALKVNASGASRISYRGNPQLNVSLSGSSTVTRD